MFSLKNALIALSWLFLIAITPLKGISQDTLINIEDVEFSSGQEESSSGDSLITDFGDVEFSDGTDTSASATDSTAVSPTVVSSDGQSESTSLWGIFIEGLLGGFLAFLMPCIFPMVPLTVSFFTKKSASKLQAVSQALTYGLFIMVAVAQ